MRENGPDAGQTVSHLDRLIGCVLDRRYRLDEKVAEGGFGAIYRAIDLVMGREVALKILHRELMADPSVVERFRREASALARLRDPHTITMYDVGIAGDGTRYIVMELLRGESLYEVFHAHGRLPWRRVAAIARGVCSSMREAHDAGIVHRDLKPANIHLEQHTLESDHVKVLDFGIAKMMDTNDLMHADLTLAGQMIGTFDYMPPEQLIGGPCTGQSDVFALGVIMYEMIAGVRPFAHAKGPTSMLMALLAGPPASLAVHADVPAPLAGLVMQMLARDPEDRPVMVDIDAALAEILTFAETVDDDDDGTFEAEDDPTWIDEAPRPPSRSGATLVGMAAPLTPPARITPSRGTPGHKLASSDVAPALSRDDRDSQLIGAQLVISTSAVKPSRAMVLPASAPLTTRFAVGSATEIDPHAGDPTPAPRTDAFAIRIAKPPPTPGRLAQGTTPIVNERALPAAPQSGLAVTARFLLIAALLFGVGFVGALAIGWFG